MKEILKKMAELEDLGYIHDVADNEVIFNGSFGNCHIEARISKMVGGGYEVYYQLDIDGIGSGADSRDQVQLDQIDAVFCELEESVEDSLRLTAKLRNL
jgi:hypothetical protein